MSGPTWEPMPKLNSCIIPWWGLEELSKIPLKGAEQKKPLVNYASTNLTNYDYVHIKSLHSNCYDYVLRISEFPDLFGNVFLISYRFSLFDFSTRVYTLQRAIIYK